VQKDPRTHGLYPAAASVSWYVPAGTKSHTESPVVSAKVPAAQGEGSVVPSAHACPIGHGSHSSPLANFVRFEYVPAPHGCGVMVPCGQ